MKLLIGWNTQDTTPAQPVELVGQYYQRTSRGVRDGLKVTVLALEQVGPISKEQTVMVTLDIIYVTQDFLDEVRAEVRTRVPDLDPNRIFINATHIHTGPAWFVPFRWWTPAVGVMAPNRVREITLRNTVRAIESAWMSRTTGGIGSAQARTPIGYNRRAIYADGSAMMYGDVARSDFVGLESAADPIVNLLYTWDSSGAMTGVIVNAACPAQVMEAAYEVSGDFFGELRGRLQIRYGPQLHLLAQVAPAGCQSPRDLITQRQVHCNYWRDDGMIEIAERLETAVVQGLSVARERIDPAAILKHRTTRLALPIRRATAQQYADAKRVIARLTAAFPDVDTASRILFERFVEDVKRNELQTPHGPFDNKEMEFVLLENAQAVIRRFEAQDNAAPYEMELHVVRIGDCAFATNPFELFVDYSQRIQARSPASQTFLVQLACDSGAYLPTERAVHAGGYSALIINGLVGPEGGRILTNATVTALHSLWPEQAASHSTPCACGLD